MDHTGLPRKTPVTPGPNAFAQRAAKAAEEDKKASASTSAGNTANSDKTRESISRLPSAYGPRRISGTQTPTPAPRSTIPGPKTPVSGHTPKMSGSQTPVPGHASKMSGSKTPTPTPKRSDHKVQRSTSSSQSQAHSAHRPASGSKNPAVHPKMQHAVPHSPTQAQSAHRPALGSQNPAVYPSVQYDTPASHSKAQSAHRPALGSQNPAVYPKVQQATPDSQSQAHSAHRPSSGSKYPAAKLSHPSYATTGSSGQRMTPTLGHRSSSSAIPGPSSERRVSTLAEATVDPPSQRRKVLPKGLNIDDSVALGREYTRDLVAVGPNDTKNVANFKRLEEQAGPASAPTSDQTEKKPLLNRFKNPMARFLPGSSGNQDSSKQQLGVAPKAAQILGASSTQSSKLPTLREDQPLQTKVKNDLPLKAAKLLGSPDPSLPHSQHLQLPREKRHSIIGGSPLLSTPSDAQSPTKTVRKSFRHSLGGIPSEVNKLFQGINRLVHTKDSNERIEQAEASTSAGAHVDRSQQLRNINTQTPPTPPSKTESQIDRARKTRRVASEDELNARRSLILQDPEVKEVVTNVPNVVSRHGPQVKSAVASLQSGRRTPSEHIVGLAPHQQHLGPYGHSPRTRSDGQATVTARNSPIDRSDTGRASSPSLSVNDTASYDAARFQDPRIRDPAIVSVTYKPRDRSDTGHGTPSSLSVNDTASHDNASHQDLHVRDQVPTITPIILLDHQSSDTGRASQPGQSAHDTTSHDATRGRSLRIRDDSPIIHPARFTLRQPSDTGHVPQPSPSEYSTPSEDAMRRQIIKEGKKPARMQNLTDDQRKAFDISEEGHGVHDNSDTTIASFLALYDDSPAEDGLMLPSPLHVPPRNMADADTRQYPAVAPGSTQRPQSVEEPVRTVSTSTSATVPFVLDPGSAAPVPGIPARYRQDAGSGTSLSDVAGDTRPQVASDEATTFRLPNIHEMLRPTPSPSEFAPQQSLWRAITPEGGLAGDSREDPRSIEGMLLGLAHAQERMATDVAARFARMGERLDTLRDDIAQQGPATGQHLAAAQRSSAAELAAEFRFTASGIRLEAEHQAAVHHSAVVQQLSGLQRQQEERATTAGSELLLLLEGELEEMRLQQEQQAASLSGQVEELHSAFSSGLRRIMERLPGGLEPSEQQALPAAATAATSTPSGSGSGGRLGRRFRQAVAGVVAPASSTLSLRRGAQAGDGPQSSRPVTSLGQSPASTAEQEAELAATQQELELLGRTRRGRVEEELARRVRPSGPSGAPVDTTTTGSPTPRRAATGAAASTSSGSSRGGSASHPSPGWVAFPTPSRSGPAGPPPTTPPPPPPASPAAPASPHPGERVSLPPSPTTPRASQSAATVAVTPALGGRARGAPAVPPSSANARAAIAPFEYGTVGGAGAGHGGALPRGWKGSGYGRGG